MTRRLIIAGLILVALSVGIQVDAHAGGLPPSGPFPDSICNWNARMDIYVSADGTVWECVCEQLQEGHVCDWFEQGSVTAQRIRRIKHHVHRRLIPVLVVRMPA